MPRNVCICGQRPVALIPSRNIGSQGRKIRLSNSIIPKQKDCCKQIQYSSHFRRCPNHNSYRDFAIPSTVFLLPSCTSSWYSEGCLCRADLVFVLVLEVVDAGLKAGSRILGCPCLRCLFCMQKLFACLTANDVHPLDRYLNLGTVTSRLTQTSLVANPQFCIFGPFLAH